MWAPGVLIETVITPTAQSGPHAGELVWALDTRCHSLLGNAVFEHVPSAPLLAYLHHGEKISQ